MYTNPYQPYQHTSKNMSVGQPRNTFEDSYKNGKIVVHGEAFITSPPDTVTILLGAITESLSLGEAHQENSKRISAVLESIRNLVSPKMTFKQSTIEWTLNMTSLMGSKNFVATRLFTYLTSHCATLT